MAEDRERFIPGYLDDRYARGDRPDTRAPRGRGLPDAKGRTMEVRTCLGSANRPRQSARP